MGRKKKKIVEKTRRNNGAGSIYQQANGLWTGKIRLIDKEGNKVRKTVYGHSEAEVADKLVKMSGSYTPLNGQFGKKTFGQLLISIVTPQISGSNTQIARPMISSNIVEISPPCVRSG